MRSTTVAPLLLLGLAACGGGDSAPLSSCPNVDADGGLTQLPDSGSPSLAISLDRASARVVDGYATLVGVRIARGGGLVGDVTIEFQNESGFDIQQTPLVIPAGSDVGLLELHGGLVSTGYPAVSTTIVARAGDVVASAELSIESVYRSGAPDFDFGSNGVFAPHTVPNDLGARVGTMADGRFVVAGTRGGNTLLIRRYLANGDADVALFGTGEITQTIGAGTHQINTLVVDEDGGILVGGFVGQTGFLARYLANGQPDDGFGASGVVFLAEGEVQQVRVRPDGRLLVVDHDGIDCHLRGLDASGQADAGYAAGSVITIHRAAQDYCPTFAVRADGSVMVFGSDSVGAGFAVSYDASGVRDNSFGSGGLCVLEPNGNAMVPTRSLALGDGRVLVSGQAGEITAVSSDCHSWPDFGLDSYLSGYGSIEALATDGRRIYFDSVQGGVLRVCATFLDGIPDRAFGNDGCGAVVDLPGTEFAQDLAVTSDGALLTVGTLNLGADGLDPFVFRSLGLVR